MNPGESIAPVAQLHEDYKNFRAHAEENGLFPELALVALTISNPIGSVDDLVSAAKNKRWKGWLRYQSAVRLLDQEVEPSDGALLYGEWCEGDESTHLRPNGAGGVVAWRYEEGPFNARQPLGDGEIPVLREQTSVLAKEGYTGKCLYHVFWGNDPNDPSAIRRLGYRFTGFEE